jgi:hypothetical protein
LSSRFPGIGLLFGTEPTGSIAFGAPMIVFAFIYGLLMDCEVLILSPVREEYDARARPTRRWCGASPVPGAW